MQRRNWLAISLVLATTISLAHAQETPPDGVIADLNAPRHLSLDDAGYILVAEAGTGGNEAASIAIGEGLLGNTGRVLSIQPDGTVTPTVTDLYSFISSANQVVGVHKAIGTHMAKWYLVGQGPVEDDAPTIPGTFALVRITPDGTQTIDLFAHEAAANPDGGVIASNPVDFETSVDGAIYIADAGANAVLKWTEEEGLTTFAAWPPAPGAPQAAPSTVLTDRDGNVYVGFKTMGPFSAGGSRVEVYDRTGALIETFEGLTMVTDLFWGRDGATLHAVQFAASCDERGWEPNSGSIVRITPEEITPLVTGLPMPHSALFLDDTFVVSVNSNFASPGAGALWGVTPGDYSAFSASFMPPMTMPVVPSPQPAAEQLCG